MTSSKYTHYQIINEARGCNVQCASTLQIRQHLEKCLESCYKETNKVPCKVIKHFETGETRLLTFESPDLGEIEIQCALFQNWRFDKLNECEYT